jgi:dimeric dUTPase (all-alpha-NTP-PPase superfamily)
MNLNKLFEIQAKLDKEIIKKKGLEGQDLLHMKILALQVELGELANELPEVFKFWSNKKNNYEKALKEYVDCLHFVLSIGLEIGIKSFIYLKPSQFEGETITDMFIRVGEFTCHMIREDVYNRLFEYFIDLGFMLEFSWEQIEQAYLEKNKINHARQEQGY